MPALDSLDSLGIMKGRKGSAFDVAFGARTRTLPDSDDEGSQNAAPSSADKYRARSMAPPVVPQKAKKLKALTCMVKDCEKTSADAQLD